MRWEQTTLLQVVKAKQPPERRDKTAESVDMWVDNYWKTSFTYKRDSLLNTYVDYSSFNYTRSDQTEMLHTEMNFNCLNYEQFMGNISQAWEQSHFI